MLKANIALFGAIFALMGAAHVPRNLSGYLSSRRADREAENPYRWPLRLSLFYFLLGVAALLWAAAA